MHEYVSFNQKILPVGEARILAAASAALYGRGVFTTVAIAGAKPFLWEKHWRRLNDNARKLKISLSDYAEEAVRNALDEISAVNKLTNARVRLTFFDETAGGVWSFQSGRKTSFLITSAERRGVSADFRLTASPFPVNSASPLANVKSSNYLENIMGFEEAKKRGFDEAVRTNERGAIVSACLANIFWMKDEKLFTAPLRAGCLAGTTREFLMEKFACAEIEAGLGDLQTADAIFLTSAGIGVVQIAAFESRKLEAKSNDFTQTIADIYPRKNTN